MLLANKEGIVITGPVVNLPLAAAANAVVVFTIPVLANQLIGTKSVKILKVHLFNIAGGNDGVMIGNGVAGGFVALMPGLMSMNNLESIYDNLLDVETFANITAYPVALPGGGTIDIQLEVAIIG